jgi:hypothetical protein
MRTIKVCLDRETPWACDLGPAPGPKGSRRVRLVNVPFMHVKPTWGDVVIVSPIAGVLTWDHKIHEDSGRWTMVIEYAPRGAADECMDALVDACGEIDVVCENAWEPAGSRSGRAYLAVGSGVSAASVMRQLAHVPAALAQLYPVKSAR